MCILINKETAPKLPVVTPRMTLNVQYVVSLGKGFIQYFDLIIWKIRLRFICYFCRKFVIVVSFFIKNYNKFSKRRRPIQNKSPVKLTIKTKQVLTFSRIALLGCLWSPFYSVVLWWYTVWSAETETRSHYQPTVGKWNLQETVLNTETGKWRRRSRQGTITFAMTSILLTTTSPCPPVV